MYKVEECPIDLLKELENKNSVNSFYQTEPWVRYIESSKKGRAVLLSLSNNERIVSYFVGVVVKKFGIRILGSPFEGWLTPEMGLIRIDEIDINHALRDISKYAFKHLKCLYVQITDKNISAEILDKKIHHYPSKLLHLDISADLDSVISGFTKNGRRDVRAAERKNTILKKVPFDKTFADMYYDQLIDVFAKQNLKPFYSKNTVYDLVETLRPYSERVIALACYVDGNCVATVFSFGYGEWAYFVGAASYRQYQKYLPNERLFLEFVRSWKEKGISHLDLMGYRQYKMKYDPKIIDVPTIYFERFKGIHMMKNLAKKLVTLLRKAKGKLSN